MKKRFLGMAAALAVFCIALVGCGGAGGTAPDYSENFKGEWEIISIEGDDPVSEEDIQTMKNVGLTVTLTLNEDGTAEIVLFDEQYGTGTWKATGENTCDVIIDEQSIPGTIDADTGYLHLTEGTDSLVFGRAE